MCLVHTFLFYLGTNKCRHANHAACKSAMISKRCKTTFQALWKKSLSLYKIGQIVKDQLFLTFTTTGYSLLIIVKMYSTRNNSGVNLSDPKRLKINTWTVFFFQKSSCEVHFQQRAPKWCIQMVHFISHVVDKYNTVSSVSSIWD